jgi:hypothetical protein
MRKQIVDFQDLLPYRDGLIEELEAGRITKRTFSIRVQRACKRFNERLDARHKAEVHVAMMKEQGAQA